MIFESNGNEYFLDIDGGVFTKSGHTKILQLPVCIAWRARCLSEKVFVSDLGSAQSIISLDLNSWEISIVDTSPVLLMNDICVFDDTYYMIDKMQGKVFKFDMNFNFLEPRLNFGFKPGFTSDPISICIKDDQIHILSWLSDRISVLDRF